MDVIAVGGSTSHALYKGGLTNAEPIEQLKAIMMATTNLAALHYQYLPTKPHKGSTLYNDVRNQVFKLFDKNEDGLISREELRGEILKNFKDVFKDLSQTFPPDRGKEKHSTGILDQWSTLHGR
eukprot:Gb_18944 [translate_table: standard]